MSDYFTQPPDLAAATKARSADINALAAAVNAAFNLLPAAAVMSVLAASVAAKGAIAGQAWTGTHDFSGATIRVPVLAYGASGSYAVSMDTLNAAVFAAANLPGQTGNAGKVLTTNGVTPSWALIDGRGALYLDHGNSGTTAQVLDVSVAQYHKITVTGAHTISTAGWPAGRGIEQHLELVNAGTNVTFSGVNFIKSDGTFAAQPSGAGVTLQAAGTDIVIVWKAAAGIVYGRVLR